MNDSEHEELLKATLKLEGMAIISGYDSDLYNDYLASFQKVTKKSRISAGRGTGIRTECLWISPNCKQSKDAALTHFHSNHKRLLCSELTDKTSSD